MHRYALARTAVTDRLDKICSCAYRKRVLHVGCADAPYYKQQHLTGKLLHAKLDRVASSLVGVDLDSSGVEFLKSHGFDEIYCASVEDLSIIYELEMFDLIVAGEIFEHLPNPAMCLFELKKLLRPGGEIVITVPNVFSLKAFLRALIGVELIHPDHLSYYSQQTIIKLLAICGFGVSSLGYYSSRPANRLKAVVDHYVFGVIRSVAPWLSDGLIVFAKPVIDSNNSK